MKKQIFVLYTGGTIGMTQSQHGLETNTDIVHHALKPFSMQYDFDWYICHPLIDSSQINFQHWDEWLQLIQQKILHYDAILILHGTDTLAYSAAFLSFFLAGIDKPIILTGSQLPFATENSDAVSNLFTACLALSLDLSGCYIAFNQQLFAAKNCTKISTERMDAFTNPYEGAIAQFNNGTWEWKNTHQTVLNQGKITSSVFNPQLNIINFFVLPGTCHHWIADSLFHTGADAVILQSFGHGNLPINSKLIESCQRFTHQGGMILNISQTLEGNAQQVYAASFPYVKAGLLFGGKMTIETAFAFLLYVKSQHYCLDEVKEKLSQMSSSQ